MPMNQPQKRRGGTGDEKAAEVKQGGLVDPRFESQWNALNQPGEAPAGDEEAGEKPARRIGGNRTTAGPAKPSRSKKDVRPRKKTRGGTEPA